VFEPSVPAEPPSLVPVARPTPPPTQGQGLKLIHDVRDAQARTWWWQGGLYGASAFVVFLFLAGFVGNTRPALAQWLVAAAPLSLFASLLFFGVFLTRRTVGDDTRTARLLAERAPELSLDLLAAVELSKALGRPDDFSPDLARAFLKDVDQRAAKRSIASLLDPRPLRAAFATLGVTLLAALITLGAVAEVVFSGLTRTFTTSTVRTARARQAITGDFELSYRYPEYTGLEARTVSGTPGDVAGPPGTEVSLKTRADRDVDEAALIVNGNTVPLTVSGRDLSGRFVLDKAGQYHVAFLDGDTVQAEGPDVPIQVDADTAPQVRILSPIDVVELEPKRSTLSVQYEATDDYGLGALALVYQPVGGAEQRITLPLDEARAARGKYEWNVGALGLKPGGEVRYFLEASDGNTIAGPQKGASKTQVVKLYSSAEHRREALRKAGLLWERLVTHLADRQESPERAAPLTVIAVKSGAAIDERAAQLAKDLDALAASLLEDKEPQKELEAALTIIGVELDKGTQLLAQRRRFLLRNAELGAKAGFFENTLASAFGSRLTVDLSTTEKNVLYLESLLDRARLDAIRELAQQLKEDRRELSRLVEELQKSNDPKVQDALLQQMKELRARMEDLQQRMAEMAKGIRDDFMNQDALDQMMEEQDLKSALDEMERLVREGKTDEALKKMQELSMQLDEMLEQIEKGAEAADEAQDPELSKAFQEFSDELDQAVKDQQQVADQTRALKDKARSAAKERIASQGEAVRKSVLEKLDELEKSYRSLDADRFGGQLEANQQKALNAARHARQAVEARDFDLAAQSAAELAENAQRLEAIGEDQVRRDQAFRNPESAQRETRRLAERLSQDAKKADEVSQALQNLFPQPGQGLDSQDQQALKDLAKQQQQLGEAGQRLKEQMQSLGEQAPIFDEEAQAQMDQAARRMDSAGQRLKGKDPGRASGDQQGALESLEGLKQQLQQARQQQAGGKGKGLPMPMSGKRRGGRQLQDDPTRRVEIPDEEAGASPREFRKDVMDAMKQGAPDRYKEQNKKYYEELVK